MKSKKIIAAFLAATLCVTPTVYASTSTHTNAIVEVAESIVILEEQGWLESAYVTWKPLEGASGYKVYYKAAGDADSQYKQLDNELIRRYPDYYRADALGLPEGDYIIKIVPVFEEEVETREVITSRISVKAHTREGFAFSKDSLMGTGSGGYNDDGSVPDDAQIIYITADNVNTVQLGVITDSRGTITATTGLVNILAARQKGYDRRPLIIRLIGTVKASDIQGLNSNGYIQIKGSYNTTLEGIGEDATVNGWGILIRESKNVEVRNLGIMLFPDDGISLDTKNENIWVHNNDIFYGTAGGDADQAKGDGAADVKAFSNYITMSYNHFWDAGKSSLCGMTESQEFFVTYHHNWYDHSDSRHPRIRKGTIHIYNNYFDGNSKYGVGMTTGGSAFVESNDFRNCKYPMLISLQGTDIADGNVGTFSKEPGGIIKAYNNQIEGASRLVYQTEDSVHFDAYLANSRDEQVPGTYQSVSGGHTYNNFDTTDKMYDYTPDEPDKVREIVTTYAGRVNGGDLKWTFTPEDDTDYSVNAGLMAAVRNYQSKLVSIGGINPTQPEEPENPDVEIPGITEGDIVHNFTEDGKNSEFFNITGNLSTSKGSVNYNGMLLTQCLKLESSTSIQFTVAKPATLTLVLDDGFSGKVDINGIKETVTDGILVKELEVGTHIIKKADTANLFYMALNMIDDENNNNEIDQEEAKKVDLLIEALPESITLDDKKVVMDAKLAYENLTDVQKALVKEENRIKLENAEKTIKDLEADLEDKQVVAFETIKDIIINVGEEYNLPKQVLAYYSDETNERLDVNWNDSQVDTATVGVYEVLGSVEKTDMQPKVNIVVEEIIHEVMGTVLSGATEVKEGEFIEISLGINNLQQPVYAGDITLTYDKDKLDLNEVTAFEQTMIAGKQEEDGIIRILTGNKIGIVENMNLLKFRFTAKDVEEDVQTNIKVDSAVFGIVVEGNGQTVKSNLADKTIIIKDIPIAPPGDVEDINKDEIIDIADLAMVAYYYRATINSDNWEEAKKADVTNDGVVDIEDLIAVASKILEN